MKHFDSPRVYLYLIAFSVALLGLQFCIPMGMAEAAYVLVAVGAWVALRETEDPK
jgi:hypothetical protein